MSLPPHPVENIIKDALSVLQQVEEIPRMQEPCFDDYREICRQIPGQIREGRLKIAVVGVIKSGKSTFVNSLIGKELVKRGAGVVTSITTRIQKGRKNRASLYLKSWDEINSQVQKALMSFPDNGSGDNIADTFDIRRKNDRDCLEKVYQALVHDFPSVKGEIRPETLLIRHALLGYDACRDAVQADESLLQFEAKEFDRHKVFTSDPDKAFYVRDVCLEVFGKMLTPNIEIADCQGADSTDPAQLAQILTYLESSNLIVYCISSRTGLRQSDIMFLNRIKNLGLLDNILFINNCDLTEHENLEDLIKIETSIRDDLEFLEIRPNVYSFSCLYALFLKLESKLSKKDLSRLRLWQEEKKMLQYCDAKFNEFNLVFKQAIDKNRHKLLISNHLNRVGIILSKLEQRADIFLDLLSSDKRKEAAAVETLEKLHQNASRLESIVSNSIEGAVRGLQIEIESNLKKAFDQDENAILKKAQAYIGDASIDVGKYRSTVKETGFKQILYFMFQDFKRGLDLYVIEEVKPAVKKIVTAQENRIISYFQSLFDSYQIDLLKPDTVSDLVESPGSRYEHGDSIEPVDIGKIKKILGLQLPAVIFEAKYSSRIKANVFADFSLQTLSQMVASLFNRTGNFSFSHGLEKAAEKIKKENQKVIKYQFEHCHAHLRDAYVLPLIAAATRDFKEKINERFIRYHSFKQETEHLFSLKHAEKKEQKKKVVSIKQQIRQVFEEIASYPEISPK